MAVVIDTFVSLNITDVIKRSVKTRRRHRHGLGGKEKHGGYRNCS